MRWDLSRKSWTLDDRRASVAVLAPDLVVTAAVGLRWSGLDWASISFWHGHSPQPFSGVVG